METEKDNFSILFFFSIWETDACLMWSFRYPPSLWITLKYSLTEVKDPWPTIRLRDCMNFFLLKSNRDRLEYNVLSGLRPSPELTSNVVDNTLSLFRRKGICLCNYIWLTQEMGKPFVDKDWNFLQRKASKFINIIEGGDQLQGHANVQTPTLLYLVNKWYVKDLTWNFIILTEREKNKKQGRVDP